MTMILAVNILAHWLHITVTKSPMSKQPREQRAASTWSPRLCPRRIPRPACVGRQGSLTWQSVGVLGVQRSKLVGLFLQLSATGRVRRGKGWFKIVFITLMISHPHTHTHLSKHTNQSWEQLGWLESTPSVPIFQQQGFRHQHSRFQRKLDSFGFSLQLQGFWCHQRTTGKRKQTSVIFP